MCSARMHFYAVSAQLVGNLHAFVRGIRAAGRQLLGGPGDLQKSNSEGCQKLLPLLRPLLSKNAIWSALVARGSSGHFLVGCLLDALAAPGRSWLLLPGPGCSWLLLAAPGLLLAPPGCSWLLLAAPVCLFWASLDILCCLGYSKLLMYSGAVEATCTRFYVVFAQLVSKKSPVV